MMNKLKVKNGFKKKMLIIFFFYIILEGAFRKWFLPNLNIEIILLRDLFIIFFIFKGFLNNEFDFNSRIEKTIFYWTILVIFWIIIQLIFKQSFFAVSLIGFRGWVLYFWFSILIFRLTKDHFMIEKNLKILIYTLIPMSLLITIQFNLPPEHFINKNIAEGFIFLLVDGIVRPTGTFSFTSGYVQYITFITPFFLYFINDSKHFKSFSFKFILLISYVLCIFFSGSRAVFINSFILIFVSLFITGKKNIIKNLFIILIICTIAYFILDVAVESTFNRFEVASRNEIMSERIIKLLFGGSIAWTNFSFIGEGIGKSSNLSAIFLKQTSLTGLGFTTGIGRSFLLGENESTRIIIEGGLLGVLFFISKFILIIYSLKKSIKILIDYKNTLPFYFSLYFSIQLLTTPVTGQLTTHAFTSLGLTVLLLLLNTEYKKINNKYRNDNFRN